MIILYIYIFVYDKTKYYTIKKDDCLATKWVYMYIIRNNLLHDPNPVYFPMNIVITEKKNSNDNNTNNNG